MLLNEKKTSPLLFLFYIRKILFLSIYYLIVIYDPISPDIPTDFSGITLSYNAKSERKVDVLEEVEN